MTLVRSFGIFVIGLSLGLLSFATPAQSRLNGATKQAQTITSIDLDELKNLLQRTSSHARLVNFWATWCDPCRDEFPDLVRIDDQYRAKGLDFIAVSLDDQKDINTEVPKFLRAMHAVMPVYLLNAADPEPAIKAVDPQWGGSLPATFLFNVTPHPALVTDRQSAIHVA